MARHHVCVPNTKSRLKLPSHNILVVQELDNDSRKGLVVVRFKAHAQGTRLVAQNGAEAADSQREHTLDQGEKKGRLSMDTWGKRMGSGERGGTTRRGAPHGHRT